MSKLDALLNRSKLTRKTFSITLFLYDGETGEALNGIVWCDGTTPRRDYAVRSITWAGFTDTNFNVNVEVPGYKNGWVPVTHDFNHDLFVRLTKLPVVKPVYEKPKGLVESSGYSFTDASGDFQSLGATFFAAGWLYHNNKEKLIYNTEKLAGHFSHVRLLMEVGGSSWSDRAMNPLNIKWDEVLQFFGSYGLRCQLSIFGDTEFSNTADKRKLVVDKVIDLCNAYPELVHYVELTNEMNFPDWDEAIKLLNYLQNNTPHIIALTSPINSITQDDILKAGTDLFTYHPERDSLATPWKWVRKHWDPSLDVNIIRDCNEPKGPGSSLESDDDPLRNIMAAACHHLTGGFVFHARPLVRSGGWGDAKYNYPTDINELKDIDTILRGFDYIRKILPKDLPNWQKLNGHWAGHPLPADLIWTDGHDHGAHRTYAAVRDNRFFTFPINVLNFANLKALDDCFIKVHDVIKCEVIDRVNLKANATYQLAGREDGNSAYIIEGEYS